MRHIITVTLRIAEASPFTLHPRITAIGTADPDTGITAGIVISKVRGPWRDQGQYNFMFVPLR